MSRQLISTPTKGLGWLQLYQSGAAQPRRYRCFNVGAILPYSHPTADLGPRLEKAGLHTACPTIAEKGKTGLAMGSQYPYY